MDNAFIFKNLGRMEFGSGRFSRSLICPLMTLSGHPYWKSTPLFIFLHRGVVQGASFRQPRLDEILPQMVPIRCIFVESSWREPLNRGQRIKPNDVCHTCPGLVRML